MSTEQTTDETRMEAAAWWLRTKAGSALRRAAEAIYKLSQRVGPDPLVESFDDTYRRAYEHGRAVARQQASRRGGDPAPQAGFQ